MLSSALLLPLPKLNPTVDMEGMEDTVVGMEETVVGMEDMDMEDTEARGRLMQRLKLPL